MTQILEKLEVTKDNFRICLSINQLYLYDVSIDKNNIFIILTETENKEIGHFVLLYTYKNGSVIIFDPAGTEYDEIPTEIKTFIKTNNKSVKFNEKRLQGPNSCLCGVFCVFFSVYLSMGYSFEEVISWFADPQWNDVSIYRWFMNRVAHPPLSSVLTPARMFQCQFGL